MKDSLRENEILDLLEKHKFMSLQALSKCLFVSESTIRRDLKRLENQNLITRTKGGAIYVQEKSIEWPFLFKNRENSDLKRKIADLALDFIEENSIIFLDSSSTCLFLAEKLKIFKKLTVITNGLTTASMLSEETEFDVFSTGGKVHSKRSSLNGTKTCQYLSQCYVDISFLSCRGLSGKMGATDFSEEEAVVKQVISQNSSSVILLADSSKFEKIFLNQSIPPQLISTIISDGIVPECIQNANIFRHVEFVTEDF